MKKIVLFSIIFSFLFFSVYPQFEISKNFNYTLSKPYKVIDAREKIYLSKGNELLLVKINDDRLTFQKFNTESLELIEFREFKDMGDEFDVELLTEINGKFFLFYSIWDDKNKKELLYKREINFDDCLFKDNGKIIISVEGKVTGKPIGIMNFDGLFKVGYGVMNKFNFQFSYDNSRMLVTYRKKPEIKRDSKNYDIIGLNVFDNNIEKQWNKEVKMPYTEKQMDAYDYSVNSLGDAYILATVLNNETNDISKGKDDVDYHIELLKYLAGTAELTTTTVTLADKFINDIWLFSSGNDNMVFTGFYNNGKRINNADRILINHTDKNGKLLNSKNYEIPFEIINQYTRKAVTKKDDDDNDRAEFKDIHITNMLVQDDGSTVLMGEQYYVRQHTSYNSATNTSTTYYTYHYNDILVTKIDADGNLSWIRKLPKQQRGTNGAGGMSFKYFYSEGFHYFMFLDNVKNMKLLMNQKPSLHADGAGGFLTTYKVDDKNGGIEKLSILDLRDAKGVELFQFKPSRIIQISPKDFILEAYKKNKEDVLIKIHLND